MRRTGGCIQRGIPDLPQRCGALHTGGRHLRSGAGLAWLPAAARGGRPGALRAVLLAYVVSLLTFECTFWTFAPSCYCMHHRGDASCWAVGCHAHQVRGADPSRWRDAASPPCRSCKCAAGAGVRGEQCCAAPGAEREQHQPHPPDCGCSRGSPAPAGGSQGRPGLPVQGRQNRLLMQFGGVVEVGLMCLI